MQHGDQQASGGRLHPPRWIVLVMAEYGVGDSPLWFRGSSDDVGLVDAAALSLSAALRDDLAAWNDVFDGLGEPLFEWPSAAVRDAHRVDAFTLASRVQLELGNTAHVWCGAGDGIDTFPTAHAAVVAPADRPGTEVESWSGGSRATVTSARAAGIREGAARAIVGWRALTERAGGPFGDAETRALGLRTAARMQADLGVRTQVVSFAGASGPYTLADLD
ncbi:hypothetical protein ACIPC2_00295 [Curtobacterium pusillum]|uniref:hypothetical protein n=1 Tax=Curtobacterium pusillum TaxID=69373 RepID=UPI0009A1F70D